MQSLLIFAADLQMARRRILEKFESSDDYRFSLEHNEDAPRHQEHILLNPWRAIRCMKEEKLLRTEFYRTQSAGTKTESSNPDTPRAWQHAFLKRFALLRFIHRPTRVKRMS
jgi:hypothetical protein